MKPKILPRRQLGDPILRSRSKSISKSEIGSTKINNLVANMHYTMCRVGGVGIAAVQVGKPIRLFIIDIRPTQHRPQLQPVPKKVIINPQVRSYGKQLTSYYEGCLSFMNFAKVPRLNTITVRYTDDHGQVITETLKGIESRVFQHELDHLNGTIFVDRVVDTKTYMGLVEYKKRIRQRRSKKYGNL